MTLWRPEEHESLTDTPWDEARARAAIARIVAEAEAEAALREDFWPIHPSDADDDLPFPPTTLYLGAAGMAWALHTLGSSLDLGALVARAVERWREEPDFGAPAPALQMGESGLLLTARVVGSSAADDERLLELVHANADNESRELMWGAPGTMIAARELGADAAWHESAELLLAQWEDDGLWTQHLYGNVYRFLGPVHGFAGNVRVLLDGGEDVQERAVQTLERYALREDGLANWPPTDASAPREIRVQWCHGAPGMVATLWDLPCEELLLAGGELTWQAGPLAKGQGLCHGTAGNGYALLKLFERTGDELWLERARAFAMHAVEQVERMRREHGRGRFTLWTGDIGVALYVTSCLTGDARVPTIDFW